MPSLSYLLNLSCKVILVLTKVITENLQLVNSISQLGIFLPGFIQLDLLLHVNSLSFRKWLNCKDIVFVCTYAHLLNNSIYPYLLLIPVFYQALYLYSLSRFSLILILILIRLSSLSKHTFMYLHNSCAHICMHIYNSTYTPIPYEALHLNTSAQLYLYMTILCSHSTFWMMIMKSAFPVADYTRTQAYLSLAWTNNLFQLLNIS